MAAVPPQEIAYQKAHASDFNAGGLSAFCIAGEIIVFAAVILRVYSRKIARIPLQADDFTLIVAMVLSVAAVILFDIRGKHHQLWLYKMRAMKEPLHLETVTDNPIVYHWGMGRHWYSLDTATQVKFEKVAHSIPCPFPFGPRLRNIQTYEIAIYRGSPRCNLFEHPCFSQLDSALPPHLLIA